VLDGALDDAMDTMARLSDNYKAKPIKTGLTWRR